MQINILLTSFDKAALLYVCTTSGSPLTGSKALAGNLVDPILEGINPKTFISQPPVHPPSTLIEVPLI